MDRNDVQNKMNDVFCEVFDNSEIKIHDQMTSNDIVGWDSFSHVNLIAAIEIAFDVEFTRAQAFGFNTVGELIDSVFEKVNA